MLGASCRYTDARIYLDTCVYLRTHIKHRSFEVDIPPALGDVHCKMVAWSNFTHLSGPKMCRFVTPVVINSLPTRLVAVQTLGRLLHCTYKFIGRAEVIINILQLRDAENTHIHDKHATISINRIKCL